MWFHGPFRRALKARASAASRTARTRKIDPARKPADIELRPPAALHTYRYQLHRRG